MPGRQPDWNWQAGAVLILNQAGAWAKAKACVPERVSQKVRKRFTAGKSYSANASRDDPNRQPVARTGEGGNCMLLTMMKGKLHRAAVTQCDLHYEGSCSIDINLLESSNILPHERVDIWNITNGARISTYAIEAPRGSKTIGINGAAARYFQTGDRVIIAAFAQMDETEAKQWAPSVVRLNDKNEVVTGIA